MTYTEPVTAPAETLDAPAEGSEQVVEGGSVEAPPSEPTSTEPPAETYKVKVDGEELEVSLDEALQGYQRQAHFTRSMQGIKAERERLAEAEAVYRALEANPQETLRILQEHYEGSGVDPSGSAADPAEQRILQTEQRLAQFEQEQAQRQLEAQIQSELQSLHSRFGEFNDDDLLAHAVEHKIANLEGALAHQRWVAEQAKETFTAQQRAQREAAEKAKQGASFVEGAGGVATGSVAPAGADGIDSIEAAYAAVLAENRS